MRRWLPLAVLRDALADLKHARRLFARRPLAVLLGVVGLALGLSVATVALSILNTAILRGEGVIDPSRVPGLIRTADRSASTAWPYAEFLQLRDGARRISLEAVLTDTAPVHTMSTATTGTGGLPTRVAFVSGGFFPSTGGRVVMGRALERADERQGGPPPVVVSFAFWTSALQSAPDVLSRTIRVGRTTATIVGVAQEGFVVPHRRAIWLPVTTYGAVYHPAPDAGVPAVEVFGRLLPEVSLAEAEAQLNGVTAGMSPESTGALRARLQLDVGLGRASSTDTRVTTVFVLTAIAVVLLLSWANVASVLVAIAVVREQELGLRLSLGAGRGRIVRQLAVEGLALAGVGAIGGLGIAVLATPPIAAAIGAPTDADLAPDAFVYTCLAILTIAVGLGAGLAPAWHVRAVDLIAPLQGSGASAARVAPGRLRVTLVAMQSATSMALMVLTALCTRATLNAASVDVGFDPKGLYALGSHASPAGELSGRSSARLARAMSELEGLPGVIGATLAEFAPFGDETRTSITCNGKNGAVVYFNRARAEYFDLMGLPLIAGRAFAREEVATGAPVAVISHSLARSFWNDRSPLGDLLPEEIPVSTTRPVVVGVVRDGITASLHEQNTFAVYEPLSPADHAPATLLIRVDPRMIGVEQVRQHLRVVDSNAEMRLESVTDRLDAEASRPRRLATLTGIVGACALTLCAVGLYGLTASLVGQRMHEMGIRVAMGAEPVSLWLMIVWQSLWPVAIGLGVGAATALAASQVSAAVFFGVSSSDPVAYRGAAALLTAAAVAAVTPPTLRAAAVDAATILRQP